MFDFELFCSEYSVWFDHKGISLLLDKYTSHVISRTMDDAELLITSKKPLELDLRSVLEYEPRLS